jgi:UDP-N-acetylglucosamine enolpyruvyl transferase
MRIMQDTIFTGTAIVAASTSGESVHLDSLYGYSLQIFWNAVAGTGVGSIIVEASNDGITFTTVTSQAIASDTNTVLANTADVFYKFMRIRVTRASGTIASVIVIINAKGV